MKARFAAIHYRGVINVNGQGAHPEAVVWMQKWRSKHQPVNYRDNQRVVNDSDKIS
jgi:hypothetical protein